MTVLIGVRCTDGVVIGADSAATSAAGQMPLAKHQVDKIEIVGGRIIVAGTGQVGLGQRFTEIVKRANTNKNLQGTCVESSKFLAREAIQDFSFTGMQVGQYGALVAAPFDKEGCLVEFDTSSFQPEVKTGKMTFVSMRSGQMLAEPFLSFVHRTFWKMQTPSVKDALFGVHWALAHTILCAPGGVGDPISLATLTNRKNDWTAQIVGEDVLEEQRVHMAAIEDRISGYREDFFVDAEVQQVPLPQS